MHSCVILSQLKYSLACNKQYINILRQLKLYRYFQILIVFPNVCSFCLLAYFHRLGIKLVTYS